MVAMKASLGELSSYGIARSTVKGAPLSDPELKKTHAFWRAANYLALGMIYLQDNPLLREELKPEHKKNHACWDIGVLAPRSPLYIRT